MIIVLTLISTLTIISLNYALDLEDSVPLPTFPLQFSANILITSHLVDANSEYPPRTRNMAVYYDYKAKKARADIEGGYEAAKYYIRRYDTKNEYMIRLPPIDDCKRSYLGEEMPYPDISDVTYMGIARIHSRDCNYYLAEDYNTRVHIYMSSVDGSPVQLVEESTENNESTPLLTYDYSDVELGAPSSEWFELPPQYDKKSCLRHIGGFPYLHIFHYFVRF